MSDWKYCNDCGKHLRPWEVPVREVITYSSTGKVTKYYCITCHVMTWMKTNKKIDTTGD